MKKRIMSLFLALAICMTLMPATMLPVQAATNGHTREEAVAKAVEMYRNQYDYDGVYGVQCVDMTVGYYRYLVGYSVSGNGCDYRSNRLPSGWKIGEVLPEPGDVMVWGPGVGGANAKYGHVAVVVDTDSAYAYCVDYSRSGGTTDSRGYRKKSLNTYSCVIRPDWPVAVSIVDGTYTLAPACAPNSRLDVANAHNDDYTNIQICSDNGNDAQKWDIVSLGNGYYKLIWLFGRMCG